MKIFKNKIVLSKESIIQAKKIPKQRTRLKHRFFESFPNKQINPKTMTPTTIKFIIMHILEVDNLPLKLSKY